MKTIVVAAALLISSVGLSLANEKELTEFLKARPSFKKLTRAEMLDSSNLYRYDTYFADSAYRSVRDDISITVLARKNVIVGFHIQITSEDRKDAPLDGNDMEEAIAKAYDLSRYSKAGTGTSGVNNIRTNHWLLVDKAAVEAGRKKAVEELSERLKP